VSLSDKNIFINVKMIDNEEIQMDDKEDNMKISTTPPLRNGI